MASLWLMISARWSLSSVQASLNVIISVLGTIGLWAFTRFWWRRGCTNVLKKHDGVPLPEFFSVSSTGDGWDTIVVLRNQIFLKKNRHLLFQLITVLSISLVGALAGPIAKSSLREVSTVVHKEIQVLPATRGAGPYGNAQSDVISWNKTAEDLNRAGFPDNQLLDFLPPRTEPWAYVPTDWEPTWAVNCTYQDNVVLDDFTGPGVHSFNNPVDASVAYRKTYDPKWFNSTEYRVTSDYSGFIDWTKPKEVRGMLFFIIIQSEPSLNNRMLHNNETLELSISSLHVQDFGKSVDDKDTESVNEKDRWKAVAPISPGRFSRADCKFQRKAQVADENLIPWPWTNDTRSIAKGFGSYYMAVMKIAEIRGNSTDPPPARDLFRLYQVYMASVNTQQSEMTPRTLGVQAPAVEISIFFLIILIIIVFLTAWGSIHYAIFMRRNRTQLRELCLPNGRIEWMIHAVRTSEIGIDLGEKASGIERKDREHFSTAVIKADPQLYDNASDKGIPGLRLARIQSSRSPSKIHISPQWSSASPARSDLGSVNDFQQEESREMGGNNDVSLHNLEPNMSPSVRPLSSSSSVPWETLPEVHCAAGIPQSPQNVQNVMSQKRESSIDIQSPVSPLSPSPYTTMKTTFGPQAQAQAQDQD